MPVNTEMLNHNEKVRKSLFRYFPLKLFILGLFICALFVLAVTVHEVFFENEQAFDNKVFSFFSRISTEGVITVMKFLTFFGAPMFLVPAYLFLIAYHILRKKYRYSLHIALIAITGTILMFGLKDLTHRHRPDLPAIAGAHNYSFPSGHELSIFIFSGILIYLAWHSSFSPIYKWLITVLLFCVTITVGISRIVLRLHYPTDVLASFCLGIVWAITSLWLLRMVSKKEEAKPPV